MQERLTCYKYYYIFVPLPVIIWPWNSLKYFLVQHMYFQDNNYQNNEAQINFHKLKVVEVSYCSDFYWVFHLFLVSLCISVNHFIFILANKSIIHSKIAPANKRRTWCEDYKTKQMSKGRKEAEFKKIRLHKNK